LFVPFRHSLPLPLPRLHRILTIAFNEYIVENNF